MTMLKTQSGKNGKKISDSKTKYLKLDLGCGDNKQEGYLGVDICSTNSTDYVIDLFKFPWSFKDGSVSHIYCSHFFEHIPAKLRFKFMDECYRILCGSYLEFGEKTSGKMTIICPYYSSMRAIQDPTHEWPPICEASFLYFNKGWREQNKLTHYDIHCDFDFNYGYVLYPDIALKSQDARNFSIQRYINAVSDLQITLIKR